MKQTILTHALPVVLLGSVLTGCQDHRSPVTPDTPIAITSILSNTTGANAICASSTGLAKVVCLAEAFKATLTATQLATAQLPYTKANALRWSNLPEAIYQSIFRGNRLGLRLDSLNQTQLAAFRNMMAAVLTLNARNEGYDELLGNLVADNYLNTISGNANYGAGNFYVALLGTPSTTGLWELQYGGHHYAFANTYNKGILTGVTPSFRGVEPTTAITTGNETYQPMEQERQAFATMLSGLSSSEQTTAKLPATYADILLGPGKDGQFPATKQGLRVGDLSAEKQARVLNIIKLYVNDLDNETAATFLAKYTAELRDTYVAYSGTTDITAKDDYVRIDGPSLWLEFSYQAGIVIANSPHPHSVWRDRISDYGGQ